MTPDQLKTSILKMAVSGKLVQNNDDEQVTIPNDEWDGDEQPFDIPKNWIWKRFSYFGELRMGKTILKNELLKEGIPVYSATQSDDVLGYLKNVELELHPDDLVIPARGNSIGFVTIIRDAVATCTQTTICCKNIHDILPVYLYYCCYAFKPVWFKYSGSAIPQVTVAQISKCMVPVPPIEEQKRIVAKIEELLPYVDRYAEAYEKLEQFNAKFPEDMKKSILQYAIQGKLVEQRPEEGTAENLYQQIQEEKQRLIKEGKIKKEKPLAEIKEDEIPFDIPESWKWVRLGQIINFQGGYAFKSTAYVQSSKNQVIRLGNVKNNNLLIHEKEVFVDDELAKIASDYKLKENDILVSMTGTRRKKDYFFTLIVRKDDLKERNLYLNQRVGCFRAMPGIDVEYLLAVLQNEAIKNIIFLKETGTANQGNLGSEDMKEFVYIPLPPLNEQNRIVAKLKELLPYCDMLVK